MKLTKKLLAVCLSLLMILSMAVPVMAEDTVVTPPTEEELAQLLEASKAALQTAVNKEINYDAYVEGTTADFTTALNAAKEELTKEDASVETLNAALAAMETAKESLVLKDGIAGAFAADNTAAAMSIEGNGVIQMDWTYADTYPIDLSGSDLANTYVAFTLTLTSGNEEVPVADAFKTGNMVLRSVRTEQENKVEYSVAKLFTDLKDGANEIKISLADFTSTGGKMDWSQLEAIRLFFDSTNGKTGPFTMKMDNIRIIDETPDDYAPVEGVLATFRDDRTYTNKGGNDKTLPGEWSSITPIDISDKDLSKVYLVVNYTLDNNTTYTDAEIFNTGYFRLRSANTPSETDAIGENNVGYSVKTLIDNGTIAQPVTGDNSVKIPLSAYTDTSKGQMDWATLTQFRLYFDNLPAGLEADTLSLKFNSITIVDENVELDEGVLGVFEDDTTYETNAKVLETPWIRTGKTINVSEVLNNAYLHVNMTLGGADAAAGVFDTGYFRLRSADTPSDDDAVGENNVGYSIAYLLENGIIGQLTEGENDLWIPLTASNDVKNSIDWTAVDRFRVYINLQEEGLDCTLTLNTVEIVDDSANVDPSIVGSFTQAADTYEASEQTVLQTGWVNADAPFDASEADPDAAFLWIALDLTNETGAADSDVFKTGKILLASSNTDESVAENNLTGENSVSVSIASLIEDGVIDPLVSGEDGNYLMIPLSAFAAEKGTMDWTDVAKFRMFIDSTDQQTGTTTMTIYGVEVIDPDRITVTKEDLAMAIDLAALMADDTLYTKESVDALEAAIADARTVYANDAATATDIMNALSALEKAVLELEPVGGTTVIRGDLDGKDGVTAADALLALQIATEKVAVTDAYLAAGDVDTTPGITANDALLILQCATQKIAAL